MVLSEDVLAVDLDEIPHTAPRPTLNPSVTEDLLHGRVEPHRTTPIPPPIHEPAEQAIRRVKSLIGDQGDERLQVMEGELRVPMSCSS